MPTTTLVCGLGVPGVAFAAGRTDVVGVMAASRVVGGPQAVVEVSVELGGGDDDIVAKRLTDEIRGVLEAKGVAMTDGYEQSKVDVSVRWDADDNHEIVVKVTNRGEATQTVEGDAACADLDPNRPVCDTDSGACVECTPDNDAFCEGDTPTCDAVDLLCRECVEHSECPDSACKIRHESETVGSVGLGQCFDPADVVTVNSDGGADFDNIDDALSSIAGDGDLVIILEEASDYNEAVSFGMGNNQDVAILAATGDNPNWIQGSGGMGPQLIINGNGRAWLHRLEIRGNQNGGVAGVRVNGGRLHVQRSRIVGNTGGGISAEAGGFAIVENSFVGGNIDFAAVRVQSGADASVLYSTLVAGTSSSVFACPMAPMDAGDVTIRNSLIAGRGNLLPEVDCDADSLSITFTATATPMAEAGMGNEGVGEFPQLNPENWFVDILDDFSLQNDSPALMEDVALWVDGDPPTDIDGTPRPAKEGPDYAGADIP